MLVCVAICAGLLVLAFVAARTSCEGGFDTYLRAGVASLVALLALPFAIRGARSAGRRLALGLGFASAASLVWVAGLFAANFRMICRLF